MVFREKHWGIPEKKTGRATYFLVDGRELAGRQFFGVFLGRARFFLVYIGWNFLGKTGRATNQKSRPSFYRGTVCIIKP